MAALAALLHDDQSFGHEIAATISNYFQSRRAPVPGNPANNPVCNPSKSLHSLPPSVADEHATESDVPQVEQNPQVLKDRIRSAMRRRVGPDTGLTAKMVARATGLTERTIENAQSGTIPRGDTLMALLDFFDASFANEIFAGTTFMVVKLSDHRAATAARMINEGIAMLQGRGR